MKKDTSALRLSNADWIEIANAVAMRRAQLTTIRANSLFHRRWRQHFDRILRALGPRGMQAAACGVAPVRHS